MDLNDYRKEIDSIDDQLIALFAQRMETAEKIAEYKKANGLRVLDARREKEKMREILDKTPDDLREYVSSLYSLIFELSRSRQSCLLGTKGDLPAKIAEAIEKTPQLFSEDAAVACQGVEGAYSEQACERLFKRPSTFFFSSFEAVFSAIEKGLCRYGVLPLENSTAGSVNAVYDLMTQHNFRIVRSVRIKVDHNLLANPGAKLENIREIYSHEQAISQCAHFLQGLPNVKVIRCENTAVAARMVAGSERAIPRIDSATVRCPRSAILFFAQRSATASESAAWSPPKMCEWRRIIFSEMAVVTSPIANSPCCRAISACSTT